MKTLSLLLMLFAATALFAQDFEVPEDYVMKEDADYAKYQKDVVPCVNWLVATPFNEEVGKRVEANKFLLTWIIGTPSVTVEMNSKVVTFLETNPEMLVIFMGGWTRYALETKDNSKEKGTVKGIETVIEFYQKNKSLVKESKDIENYIKMKDKGTLDEYIKKKV